VSRLLRRLRREESGFTLVELLVACLIGTIVLLASFMMLDSSIVLTGKVTDRVDRTQRARGAMEEITRELRSQVCPSAGTPALIDAQDYSITFYSFMGLRPFIPDKRQISWDTNTNSVIESVWAGSGTPGNFSWAATPATKTILTDVKPPYASGTSGPRGPVFKYYAPGAASPFTAPLAATDLGATSRITIDFVTYAQSRNTTGTTTTLQNEVYVRTADPNGAAGSTAPECA
jgi:prepilin-type N-terminal cleavage/methylation domain-containing protein